MLDNVLGGLLADELLAAASAAHARLTVASLATVAPALAQVPHVANLVSGQDRFGRTPLHVAAATDNAFGVRVLARHMLASLASPNVSDVAWRNVTAAAVLQPDVNGMTPRALAAAAGNAAAAEALAGLEGAVAAAHPLSRHNTPRTAHVPAPPAVTSPALPLPPRDPSTLGACPRNGGWEEPRFVSSKARAAVAAYRQYAPSECEIDGACRGGGGG